MDQDLAAIIVELSQSPFVCRWKQNREGFNIHTHPISGRWDSYLTVLLLSARSSLCPDMLKDNHGRTTPRSCGVLICLKNNSSALQMPVSMGVMLHSRKFENHCPVFLILRPGFILELPGKHSSPTDSYTHP